MKPVCVGEQRMDQVLVKFLDSASDILPDIGQSEKQFNNGPNVFWSYINEKLWPVFTDKLVSIFVNLCNFGLGKLGRIIK